MPERLDAYRMYMLGEHTHTWGSWLLDHVGEVEVCDCGQTRVPRPVDEPDALTSSP